MLAAPPTLYRMSVVDRLCSIGQARFRKSSKFRRPRNWGGHYCACPGCSYTRGYSAYRDRRNGRLGCCGPWTPKRKPFAHVVASVHDHSRITVSGSQRVMDVLRSVFGETVRRKPLAVVTRYTDIENPTPTKNSHFPYRRYPGPRNLGLSSRLHFFSAARQLSTTVIGTLADCSTGVGIRKRPSLPTSKTKSLPLTECTSKSAFGTLASNFNAVLHLYHHHVLIGPDEVLFLAVAAPYGSGSAVRGNLPFAPGSRESLDVNLKPFRLI